MKTIFETKDALGAELAALVKRLEDTGDGADAVAEKTAEYEAVATKCTAALKAQELISTSTGTKDGATTAKTSTPKAKSFGHGIAATIGEYIAKGEDFNRNHNLNLSLGSFPAKANTDTHVRLTEPEGLVPVDTDLNIVKPYIPRFNVADWLGSGTLKTGTLHYFEEKPDSMEGEITGVAENTKKNQVHFGGYDRKIVTLTKLAAYIKISTEMLEDQDFLASEINARLLLHLALAEEKQLLTGTGGEPNITGLLNVSGLQTATAAGVDAATDEIFKQLEAVESITGYTADGIIMNPADYLKFRLKKDQNGQYIAGGPFIGQYGNGSMLSRPNVWGVNTMVTAAIPQGTVLVGAGKVGATVYRKGSVDVRTAFQNDDDFVNNRVCILAEKRLQLAVRIPKAFVKLTLTGLE